MYFFLLLLSGSDATKEWINLHPPPESASEMLSKYYVGDCFMCKSPARSSMKHKNISIDLSLARALAQSGGCGVSGLLGGCVWQPNTAPLPFSELDSVSGDPLSMSLPPLHSLTPSPLKKNVSFKLDAKKAALVSAALLQAQVSLFYSRTDCKMSERIREFVCLGCLSVSAT